MARPAPAAKLTPGGDVDRLHGVIRDLSDPLVIMRRVVEQALALVDGADGAVVELAHGEELVYVCASGTLAEHVGTRLRLEGSLSGLTVRSGRTLACRDAASDDRVDGNACRRVGAMSMVCVPLNRDGETIGVLKVSARRPEAFTDTDVQTMSRLAAFITAAIGASSEISRVTAALLDDTRVAGAASREAAGGEPDDPAGPGISEFVANILRPGAASDLAAKQLVERALDRCAFTVICQPIVELCHGALVGVEALARFDEPPAQPPDVWFAQAHRAGLGAELQLAAVRTALALLDELPGGAFLAINVGPDVVVNPGLAPLIDAAGRPERIVLELTEHLQIDEFPDLPAALDEIRARGTRLAIDDTGTGFASLSQIVNLAPDLIKLDRQFTCGIDVDPVRRALAQALVSFARETGAQVIAEGLETGAELEAIRRLGIRYGQGYLLSRPAPLASVPHAFPHITPGAGSEAQAGCSPSAAAECSGAMPNAGWTSARTGGSLRSGSWRSMSSR